MKTIGALAFYHCTALSSVTIPNSVTKINSFAFDSCVSLKSIVIPNSVTDMGDYTFMDCKKLTSISLSNGLTKIGTDNFRGCTSLASLAIPESVTSIGARAFQESGITSITLPNSVSAIGRDAFLDCVNLSSVCFGKGVSSSSFDYSAFDGCSNITSVEYHCKEIGDWFIGGESIKEVVIGDEVTSIGSSAFSGCTGLTSVTIPNSVTSIGVSAFRGCSGLTSITIPESVASIGSYAFENCTGLTSVTIGNGVTSIGEYAFVWCTSLKTIIIPHSVTSIGGGAFDRCTNIKDLHCYASNVPSTSSIFLGLSMELATLHVPAVALADYRNAWPWSSFGTIKAIGYEVTIPAEGVCTYSNAYDIDFTGVTGLMAYVASGFSPSTGELTLTRVYEVPAGEGLVLKGNVGKYEVPYATTDKVYSNLLKGVTKVTTVAPTDGDYTNFILANGSHGTGFYTLANTGELAAGKSYLQLLTTDISALAREGVSLMFSDETLGLDILTISSFDNSIYDLQGRRVENPMHGLYIVNGKKVIIK